MFMNDLQVKTSFYININLPYIKSSFIFKKVFSEKSDML